MRILLCSAIAISGLFSCVKRSNPTPQLASGNAFVVPADSLAEIFKSRPVPPWAPKKHTYKPASERLWDLLHTRLELTPDWEKQQLSGIASLRLQPYFYPQDTLRLDAKGFQINSIKTSFGKTTLKPAYRYDGQKIHVWPGMRFQKGQELTIVIDYIAKPNELPAGGSKAITDDRGLYFINHDGKTAGMPRQIWTQGETQGARCWFPVIDEPNERCTQEMFITVENRFKTLSNGVLIRSVKKGNGMRTDVWEMNQPHAPYLFMMAIGEYAVVPDKWGKVPLHYWVEPKYEKLAKKIFGKTPAMMSYFSELLDYPFPWPKYDQVVVRKFVSGAMENTSASVFMEALQSSEKELVDRNWEDIIAHELFHQWFGDLVTLESWANLPLNESFANYSEYLWLEKSKGKDEADYAGLGELQQYLYESTRKCEPLIRFQHDKPDDMFDSHSYAKGGRILHLLRHELGDEAFFGSLRLYLKRHAFKSVEVHDLRLAFEEVSGRDLNWFFNQWFLSAGHPQVSIEQNFAGNNLIITIQQEQDTMYFPVYRLNIPVDLWVNGTMRREVLSVSRLIDTFRIALPAKPEMVLYNADQSIPGYFQINRSNEDWQNQYLYAQRGIHRLLALENLRRSSDLKADDAAVWEKALSDSFRICREYAVEQLARRDSAEIVLKLPLLQKMALADASPDVRKEALTTLARIKFPGKQGMLELASVDSSLAVSSEALRQYFLEEYPDAAEKRKKIEADTTNDYSSVLSGFYAGKPGEESFYWFKKLLVPTNNNEIYDLIRAFGRFLDAEENDIRKAEGADILFRLAMEGNRPDQVIGAYQAIKGLGYGNSPEKLREIRNHHRDDDFYEILEYLD